jgi:hypothetical protein
LYFGHQYFDGVVTQSFTDNPGQTYYFSFWYSANGTTPSDFNAYWDGQQLLSLTNPNTGGQWTEYIYAETGTGSDWIQFAGRNDPDLDALDNVSVTPTPEPTSLLLLVLLR